MPAPLTLQQLKPGEEARAVELILASFDRFVAPDFSPQGVAEFKTYVTVEALRGRMESGSVVFTATVSGALVGVAEVRECRHLCMFFVDPARQQRGVGRALLGKVVEHCAGHPEEPRAVTVNSSPNAVGFYQRMGFVAQDQEQTRNGIRHLPMRYDLDSE